MTNREILSTIKSVKPLISHIKKRAKIIIKNTFNQYIQIVTGINVSDTYAEIFYEYRLYGKWDDEDRVYYGEWIKDKVQIPMEWFDEGFDYKSAYKELYFTQL